MANWCLQFDKKSLWFHTPWFFFCFDFPIADSSYRFDRHDVLFDFHFDLTFAQIHFEFSFRDKERTEEFSNFTLNIFQKMHDPDFEQELKELDRFCKSTDKKKSDQNC
jgi:hypothetical protein